MESMGLAGLMGSLAATLLLLQSSEACDRDGWQGQVRIDRIKSADIVLYGVIEENHVDIIDSNLWHIVLKFKKFCVVHNEIDAPDLDEQLKSNDLIIKDHYRYLDCVREFKIFNANKNKLALLTLKYDSRENQLILEQINDETGVHITEENEDLVEKIDALARDTADEAEARNRWTALSSSECSGSGLTGIQTTVGPASGRGTSPGEVYLFPTVLLMSLLTHWVNVFHL